MEIEEALPGPSSRLSTASTRPASRNTPPSKSKRRNSTSQGKGKGRAAPEPEAAESAEGQQEDRDNEGELEDRLARARCEEAADNRPRSSNKATRRMKALRNAEKFVHIPPVPPPPNPSTYFLQSLHQLSSQFYSSHSLLHPPVKRQRAVPWASKKSLQLARDRNRLTEVQGGEVSEDGEEIEDILGDREEAGGTPSMGAEDQDGQATRGVRGKYKVKDMYKAIEGEGLMAMGILVQEHIIQQLEQSGYQRPEKDASVDEEIEEEEEERESSEE
ncbi:hypothetical protein L202_07371 [Cryptococcus amylolentus CBS 6039]|uniref:Uncharacterized protein n=2 Tax=Cryptococcus amylolentus TaxID=104669 RepID=A0A1E3HBX3_9TREE|nr:hypothetical protein L202_07371 [Cryptococcus amylolentus CBS 6039]ODN73848.1 hypothetical protein L202_07371 [Cryptococcus amylolentus CBS 6039]ODO00294.1 hypothetical protein I350_06924 [Cryptococcus amylolentus CBS 6273]